MTDPILFPTDYSACAEAASHHAADLAARLGARLHALHVLEDRDAPTDRPTIARADVAADLRLPPDPTDEPLVETEVLGHDPAAAILDAAYDLEAGLIVMSTHGRRGLQRATLGSVTEHVVRRAPCPVLAVRCGSDRPWPPRRVLLAVDAEAIEAGARPASARWAARLATATGAPLDLAHIASPVVEAVGEDAEAAAALAALAERIGHAGAPVLVPSGDAATGLRALAHATDTDLIVVGTHARTGMRRLVLGSVAEEVLRTAPCPVLVVRDVLAGDGHEFTTARAAAH